MGLMVRRQFHNQAGTFLHLVQRPSKYLVSNENVQKRHDKQWQDYNHSSISKERAADKANHTPGRRTGDYPGQGNRHDTLSPGIDHSRSRNSADVAAKADEERHNRFSLQPQLCHGIIEYIGDSGHIADIFHQAKDKADSEHIACHLQSERNGGQHSVTEQRHKERRCAYIQQPVCKRNRDCIDKALKKPHQWETDHHRADQAQNNHANSDRLSPAFAGGRFIKPAPKQLVLLAGYVLIHKFIYPLEFAIACQKVPILNTGQLLFNRGISGGVNVFFHKRTRWLVLLHELCGQPCGGIDTDSVRRE